MTGHANMRSELPCKPVFRSSSYVRGGLEAVFHKQTLADPGKSSAVSCQKFHRKIAHKSGGWTACRRAPCDAQERMDGRQPAAPVAGASGASSEVRERLARAVWVACESHTLSGRGEGGNIP